MRITLQLLKEFWLPAAVATIWTLINFITASTTDRSFTFVINILAPSFFFVSWLAAQYFRVNKQQQVSTSLDKIETRVLTVLDRLEKQTNDLSYLSHSSIVQMFDQCIDDFRDAKEEIADLSRKIKNSNDIDPKIFLMQRGHPFYTAKKSLNALVAYAQHVVDIDQADALMERYTRCSYHIEELAGQMRSFIGRLNHQKVFWKTARSKILIDDVCSRISQFESSLLSHSIYSTQKYKDGAPLSTLLKCHISELRSTIK